MYLSLYSSFFKEHIILQNMNVVHYSFNIYVTTLKLTFVSYFVCLKSISYTVLYVLICKLQWVNIFNLWKVSSLEIFPKKIQGEFRLIHYLSWILLDKFAMVHCVHILDGFLFIGYPISPELCYTDGFTPSDDIIYW